MGVNLFWGILCRLDVCFILYFPKDKSFWMNHTTVVRFGKIHKGKHDIFTHLMAV